MYKLPNFKIENFYKNEMSIFHTLFVYFQQICCFLLRKIEKNNRKKLCFPNTYIQRQKKITNILLHLTNGCANHTREYHMIPIKFYLKFILFFLYFSSVLLFTT